MAFRMRTSWSLGFLVFALALSFAQSRAWAGPGQLFGPAELGSWTVQGNGKVEATPEMVVLKGSGLVALIPPKGASITIGGNVLGLNLSAGRDLLLTVYVRSNGGLFPERVSIRAGHGEGPVLYRLFIDADEYGDSAELAYVEIQAAHIDLGVHSVYSAPADGFELASALWEGFWRPSQINAATITTVATPLLKGVSFQLILFFIIALLIPVFLYAASRARMEQALQAAVLFAFIAAGSLFAARMDYNWLVAWSDEAGKLSGKSTADRVKAVNNGYLDELMDQTGFMRQSLPEGAKVSLSGVDGTSRLASLGRYYLLPVRASSEAGYIWTYRAEGLSLDTASGSLMKDGQVVASPVRLVKDFGKGSALFVREERQ